MRVAYAFNLLVVVSATLPWFNYIMSFISQIIQLITYLLVASFLTHKLNKFGKENFTSETRSIKNQSWIFFIGLLCQIAYIILLKMNVDEGSEDIENVHFEINIGLTIMNCFSFVIPNTYFMIVHHRIFKGSKESRNSEKDTSKGILS